MGKGKLFEKKFPLPHTPTLSKTWGRGGTRACTIRKTTSFT